VTVWLSARGTVLKKGGGWARGGHARRNEAVVWGRWKVRGEQPRDVRQEEKETGGGVVEVLLAGVSVGV